MEPQSFDAIVTVERGSATLERPQAVAEAAVA
jgi:hypothetical protein